MLKPIAQVLLSSYAYGALVEQCSCALCTIAQFIRSLSIRYALSYLTHAISTDVPAVTLHVAVYAFVHLYPEYVLVYLSLTIA